MALSEQEQRALYEIERSLMAEDPKFGRSVAREGNGGIGNFTLRGIAVVVIGLVMLVGGMALAQSNLMFVALSVVGFLVMFGGAVWMLRGGGGTATAKAPKKAKAKPAKSQGGFASKMEENFKRRFDN
ncbi:DUF3040 domain-containing protein [Corynebacterium pseudopelargi]|uniref:DUF3040 domain-containing protein n=1 Tax=Corynebacterium pseudopelargi TaxID=2080757 RepID=A0A3G6IW80_9CORY|nr:DUF3040 domain-containing protein [Corynebacterium pseudopelargi]AZA08918.1 hypothetical protein CPPEL_03950 [Corynebacterium pseudopelargi]